MTTTCKGGCAIQTKDPLAAGWRYLELSGGWRCGTCQRELEAASSMTGQGVDEGDTLPPDSRGMLPKETASTIVPPAVVER